MAVSPADLGRIAAAKVAMDSTPVEERNAQLSSAVCEVLGVASQQAATQLPADAASRVEELAAQVEQAHRLLSDALEDYHG